MNKKVLMIAFYYPPSSAAAVQRTLKATEYLNEHGWQPIVLTAKSAAYDALELSQPIPSLVEPFTYRTGALDVQNHLAYKGKHFAWMAAIDRWTTWVPSAILKGRKLISEYQPDLIWSTTPTPSANIIGNYLAQKSGIPWVADYQDPFGYHHVKMSGARTRIFKAIDRLTINNCKAAVFATKHTMDVYQQAFAEVDKSRFHTVENGFDENNWKKLEHYYPESQSPISKHKFSLYYSGVLYSHGRNPEPVFQAISELKKSGLINRDNFELVFQGSGDGSEFAQVLAEKGITDMVLFQQPVPFLDSLYYMKQANALLLIQDAIFNLQVPGKLYEYIRTGRPIITLTPAESATAQEANKYSNSAVAKDANAIAETLKQWLENEPAPVSGETLQHFSRYEKTAAMADIFNQVVASEH